MQYYDLNFLICTVFGVGKFFKKFPGTIGSLIAIPLAYLISEFAVVVLRYAPDYSDIFILVRFLTPIILTMILFFIGIYSSHRYSVVTGLSDPGEIIIDEIVAQMLCILVTIPLTFALIYANLADRIVVYYDVVLLVALVGNVVLFRFFDIVKPWPIRWFERKVKGGFGIMFDDIIAAVFTMVIYFAVLLGIVDYLSRG